MAKSKIATLFRRLDRRFKEEVAGQFGKIQAVFGKIVLPFPLVPNDLHLFIV